MEQEISILAVMDKSSRLQVKLVVILALQAFSAKTELLLLPKHAMKGGTATSTQI
jgi:hypothetical protein